jgi:hypothetical protein
MGLPCRRALPWQEMTNGAFLTRRSFSGHSESHTKHPSQTEEYYSTNIRLSLDKVLLTLVLFYWFGSLFCEDSIGYLFCEDSIGYLFCEDSIGYLFS